MQPPKQMHIPNSRRINHLQADPIRSFSDQAAEVTRSLRGALGHALLDRYVLEGQ